MSKKIFVPFIALLLFAQVSPLYALSVWCKNCSNTWTQALDRVTNLEQLKFITLEHAESLKQTYQQVETLKNNILQYENMLQNTKNLPANLITMIANDLSKLAQTTKSLSTLKDDVTAMGAIYDNLYPQQDHYQALNELGIQKEEQIIIDTEFDTMSLRIDEATKATFQLSGKQLNDLQSAGQLEEYINELVANPKGQMQALSSANQLASLQIQEARQLRELVATQIQTDLSSKARDEKERQLSKETVRKIMNMSNFKTESQVEEIPLF